MKPEEAQVSRPVLGKKEIVAPYDMHVQSLDGVHGQKLVAGEVTIVNDAIFEAALRRGCSIPGGVAGTDKLDEKVVEQLVNAMKLFRQAGDPDTLTASGEPRASELKKIVPNFTKEQREEAWNQVLAEETDPVGMDEEEVTEEV